MKISCTFRTLRDQNENSFYIGNVANKYNTHCSQINVEIIVVINVVINHVVELMTIRKLEKKCVQNSVSMCVMAANVGENWDFKRSIVG